MPTLHLVVDEVVPVHAHCFRVRVWRGIDSRALVLLSQIPGHPPPDWCSSALANLVFRTFLGYTANIPTFIELSRWDGRPRSFRVRFETIGCQLRPILINPQYVPINPEVVQQLFKGKLDTRNQGVPRSLEWRLS
jgi:hypothetical protein